MGLASPLSLLWLLLVVPPIVLLYLLKLRRREVVVSSVLLWTQLLKEAQANAPFQKLRRNLLLLLQLLVVGLAVFALARPFVRGRSMGGKNVVLVLDGSASMQSRDAGGTRFEAARAAALRMVDGMQGEDRLVPILATSRATRLAPLTGDRELLRQVLRAVRPADTTTDLRDALGLAAATAGAAASKDGATIAVLSDGAVGDLGGIDTRGAELRFIRFGERAEDSGIVAFAARRTPGGRDYQAFVAVRNFGSRARRANLELYRDDELIDVRPVAFPATGAGRSYSEQAVVLEDIPPGSAILRAHLDGVDDLAVDDDAFEQLSPPRERRVLLVTNGDLFLEKALALDPETRLTVVPPAGYHSQPGYDVVVLDGVSPREVGPGSFLYLDAGGSTCPVELDGRAGPRTVGDWSRPHPVARYVNLQGVRAQDTLRARVRPWGQELAGTVAGPLIAAGERQDARIDGQLRAFRSLYLGFSLQQSNFWQRVGFPIFIANALDWLAARPGDASQEQLHTGETAEIGLPDGLRDMTVVDPRGERHHVVAPGPVLFYSDTGAAGIYRIEGPRGFRRRFCASLLSRAESDTHPRSLLQLGRRPVLASTPTRPANRETWRWFALAALAVLAAEWIAFHRRL